MSGALDQIAAAAGAQASAQAGDAGVTASLSIQVGRLADAITASRRAQAAANLAVRFIKPPPVELTVPASGTVSFDLGGPATGYQWTTRRVAVTDGALLSNTVAGVAGIYGGQPSAGLIAVEQLEWILPTLPNVANFSADQLIVQYGEHLLVQVTGATPGQVLMASCAYQLYMPQGAAQTRVDV